MTYKHTPFEVARFNKYPFLDQQRLTVMILQRLKAFKVYANSLRFSRAAVRLYKRPKDVTQRAARMFQQKLTLEKTHN